MAKYKSGLKTKETLYNSAKKMFYLNGYHDTTIKDIVNDKGIKLGLFPYYFESKEAVAMQIFQEFVNDIVFELKNCLKEDYEENNFLLIDILEYRSFFKLINSNKNITKFYIDISNAPHFAEITKNIKKYFISRFFESGMFCKTNTMINDKSYFDTVSSATSGMELFLFSDLLQNKLDIDYEDAIDFFLTEYYRFLVNDKTLISNELTKSRKIITDIKLEVVPYFNICINE